MDAGSRPTPGCQECLRILASPGVEMDLVWGNAEGVSLSKVYAAGENSKLVSFTRIDGSNHLSYFLSPQDITDLIVEKTAGPSIREAVDLSIETSVEAMPVFFALLDSCRESQLRTALERRREAEVTVTADDANRITQTAKVELDMSWYAPVAYVAVPMDTPITGNSIAEGIKTLNREGIIGANGVLNARLVSFARAAFPLVSFVGVRVVRRSSASLEKTQLALFRGFSTLLLVQMSSDGAAKQVLINSISTSQLPELLFSLATRPFEVEALKPAPQTQAATSGPGLVCAKCGAPSPGGAGFCVKCGAPLPLPSTANFCRKCGRPVTTGAKFCNKCGARLD
ncbi:MAG: zinc ribbon domain-containing protein [Chloroflexi bacterium]|nr:zinc ribbon domain-containing protein [Chloroflexota bacterium]